MPLEKWLYFLRYADAFEADELAKQLVDDEFREAAGVLKMISQTPEDRQFYEARMKFLHDEEARLIAAWEEGRQEGRQEGLDKGLERGLEKGSLVGKIQLLQQLLGESESGLEELLQREEKALAAHLVELQDRLRLRGV